MKRLTLIFSLALFCSSTALALTENQIDEVLSKEHTGKSKDGISRKCKVTINATNQSDLEVTYEYGYFGEERFYLEDAIDKLRETEIDTGSFSKIVSFTDSYSRNEINLGVGYYKLNGKHYYKIGLFKVFKGGNTIFSCEYM